MSEEPEKDIFGLKKMSINQEVVISFTLFTLGMMLIIATYLPIIGMYDLGPGILGLIMVATGYLFAIESIRELEEKDHFLSRLLERKSE